MLARTSEPDAFGELFDRWYPPVHGLIATTVLDLDTSATIAHDAFALCWRNLAKLEEPASFGGWVMRIAQTLGARHSSAAPVDGATASLLAALAALGDRDRTMLELHVRQGFDAATVASSVGLSDRAAQDRIGDMLERGRPAVDALLSAPAWTEPTPLSKHHAAELLVADAVPIGRSDSAAGALAELGANERFEAALGAALGAARAEDAAGETELEDVTEAGPSRRRLLVGALAVVVLVGVVVVWANSGDSPREVVSGRLPTTTAASSTSTTAELSSASSTSLGESIIDPSTADGASTTVSKSTSTTARGATTSTKPGTATGPTTVSPGGTIAGANPDPSTTTTAAPQPEITTTTVAPLVVNFGLGNATQSSAGYAYPSTTAPSLSWSVTGPAGTTAAVTGPSVSSTGLFGSVSLPCYGRASGGMCQTDPTTKTFTITVKDSGGAVLTTRTQTLTIT